MYDSLLLDNKIYCTTDSYGVVSFDISSKKIDPLQLPSVPEREFFYVVEKGKKNEIILGGTHKLVIYNTLNKKAVTISLPGLTVYSITQDGNVFWIGTNQGLNVYAGGSALFTNPKLDRYIIDQDGSLGYLMGEETINDICIDGGNRKWMATNNGLFLVDEYGQRVLKHFNKDNSPLISDRVICVGQVNTTGEIFAGTDKGIISYRSDASEAAESFEKLKIYPNPVTAKYDGIITIEGLTSNAEVKIADATGKLIYQTKANGGKATWNGLRLDGSKPNSGVLFVFAINSDGSETAMGKFIYIH